MEINNYLKDLNDQYIMPKIIYMDVNMSIHTKKYLREKTI